MDNMFVLELPVSSDAVLSLNSIDALENEGKIYSTIDDEHWKVVV